MPYTIKSYGFENYLISNDIVEIRKGGYGSDLDGHPTNLMQFYALTDRGPNITYFGAQGEGKNF